MKVNITSDGTSTGTFVHDSETGEEIKHITEVDINILPNEFKAQITFLANVDKLTINKLECNSSIISTT